MLLKLSKTLIQDCGLNQTQPVIVGVSGGADSLCLLDIFQQLGYMTIAVHFDHGIRTNSILETQKVQAMCEKKGIPIVIGQGDVPQYAKTHSIPVEEAARILRYNFLFEQARFQKAQAVTVAHHSDDQVETILMNLLRGSGLDGLLGMSYRMESSPWSKSIPLIRPLLGVWKHEIEAYCLERGLDPIQDPSNQDNAFFRNRIRHHLIPDLDGMVPGVRERLWKTAELLKADHAVIQAYIDDVWVEAFDHLGEGSVNLSKVVFDRQPLGVQRRLIRRAVALIRSNPQDIDYALVKRVMDFVSNPTQTRQADIGLGLRIALETDWYILARWDADPQDGQWPQVFDVSWLDIPGELALGFGWFLRVEDLLDRDKALQEAHKNQDPYCVCLSIGETATRLTVRMRRLGEKFHPLGMEGKGMKLSDFMINRKMPKLARNHWPLISKDDEIIWVPGYQLSDAYRLTPESTRVIQLTLTRIEEK